MIKTCSKFGFLTNWHKGGGWKCFAVKDDLAMQGIRVFKIIVGFSIVKRLDVSFISTI